MVANAYIMPECSNRRTSEHCCFPHCPLGPPDCISCLRELRVVKERVAGYDMHIWDMNTSLHPNTTIPNPRAPWECR
jgi:hypothetical protein